MQNTLLSKPALIPSYLHYRKNLTRKMHLSTTHTNVIERYKGGVHMFHFRLSINGPQYIYFKGVKLKELIEDSTYDLFLNASFRIHLQEFKVILNLLKNMALRLLVS